MTTETILPRLGEMTSEQKRIAIAEACGWYWENPFNKRKKSNRLVNPNGGACTVWRDGVLGGALPPNYPGSLDAMAEAEKALINSTNEFAYQCHLKDISGQPYGYRATAAQRADAFLLALGLAEKDF